MNKKIFKKSNTHLLRNRRKIHSITLCLMLIVSLLLGGCSNPSSNGADSTSIVEPSSGKTEAESQPSSSENQDDVDSSENQEEAPSDVADEPDDGTFDYNQHLSLKAPEPAAGESPRILFVGNSHTYTNDLPSIFAQIAEAMGHGSDVQELTEGAYNLTEFADPQDQLGAVLNQKLTEEAWDFVIIQENTNDAFSSPEQAMLPAAMALDEKIRAAGGQTALLMTWSPKNGASIFSLEDVQSVLTENLITVSENLDSLLIPGGVAFMRCLEQYPQIELWAEDEMHPSLEGSYLASCVAYAVIFQESPEGCAYTAALDAETAAQLQSLAAGFLAK